MDQRGRERGFASSALAPQQRQIDPQPQDREPEVAPEPKQDFESFAPGALVDTTLQFE